MAHTRTQRRENELPYIPFGPFQIRLPFIHYKIESVEFIQGLILGVTALAAVPYLEQYLGLPYELAWSCVIIETFLYLLHSLLGDPVVPGWITPTLPLTIVFLEGFLQCQIVVILPHHRELHALGSIKTDRRLFLHRGNLLPLFHFI